MLNGTFQLETKSIQIGQYLRDGNEYIIEYNTSLSVI